MRDDAEWTLGAGDLRCAVSPFGASLRRLWVETPSGPRDILWGYTGTANKKGGQGDVLMPFPGRIRDGRYTFQGKTHQLTRNDKEGPNAIHGFLRGKLWEGQQAASGAVFHTTIAPTDHAGYPFSLEVVVGYDLTPIGLTCAFVARNTCVSPVPFGAGFHPYLLPRDLSTARLTLPASRLVEFSGLLPTGNVIDVPGGLDFRQPRPVGATRLNHCYTGLTPDADGFTRVHLDDLELWMGPAFSHVVLYTGDALGSDARRGVAVEPMTCATDAFNHEGWGTRVLAAGEAFQGSWGIALR